PPLVGSTTCVPPAPVEPDPDPPWPPDVVGAPPLWSASPIWPSPEQAAPDNDATRTIAAPPTSQRKAAWKRFALIDALMAGNGSATCPNVAGDRQRSVLPSQSTTSLSRVARSSTDRYSCSEKLSVAHSFARALAFANMSSG